MIPSPFSRHLGGTRMYMYASPIDLSIRDIMMSCKRSWGPRRSRFCDAADDHFVARGITPRNLRQLRYLDSTWAVYHPDT
jgi:hypothetical protein